MKIAPEATRKLRADADYITYVADEWDRATAKGVVWSAISISSMEGSLENLEGTLGWQVPTVSQIVTAVAAASAVTVSITSPIMGFAMSRPEMLFLAEPPESFCELSASERLISILKGIHPEWADLWRGAWDGLSLGGENGIKQAAVNARTVVDEISRKPPYDHLTALPWCQLDSKQKPTRATRFCWIRYGDNPPEGLDPGREDLWMRLREDYDLLQKYVHTSSITPADATFVRAALNAIQDALEQYLTEGSERLNECTATER